MRQRLGNRRHTDRRARNVKLSIVLIFNIADKQMADPSEIVPPDIAVTTIRSVIVITHSTRELLQCVGHTTPRLIVQLEEGVTTGNLDNKH